MTRIAPIARCTTPKTSLSRSRISPAAALIWRFSRPMASSRSGQTPRARRVSSASSCTMTADIPTSRMSALAAGNRQFMVSAWSAKVSAVTRYSRSPAWARLWKAIESRCRWA